MLHATWATLGVVLFVSPGGAAAETRLTLDQALARARTNAPALLAARARVDEARGLRAGAAVLLRENPAIEAAVGPRLDGGAGAGWEVEVSQAFELGGLRSSRIAGAEAGIDRAFAETDELTRRLLRDVGIAYYRGLYAQERLDVARAAAVLARDTQQIAEKRHRAGDVPVLHVNVASTAYARASAEVQAAAALVAGAAGELRALLDLEPAAALVLVGNLDDRVRFEAVARDATVKDRPEIRLLDAELHQARAEHALGRGARWPEPTLGLRYTNVEAGSAAVLGVLTLRLPLFDRGQARTTIAAARMRRLHQETRAAERRAAIEAHATQSVFRRRVDAVAELARALPLLEENERLSRRGYEVGQLGLAELLLIRREMLETKVDYLSRLFEAAVAGIELLAATGALR
jgi:outer membrane protein, heavy metal efflux system